MRKRLKAPTPSAFAERYAAAQKRAWGCPIEAGIIGRLADNECKHDRLAHDSTPPCGCWSEEVA
jgi:hypothetical protein